MGGCSDRRDARWRCLVLLLLLVGSGMAQKAEERPNIIFIFVDDLGYNDLGIMGSRDVKSPNINRLARRGAKFTNGYSMAAFCSPARAGALSGINPPHFGHYYNPAHLKWDTEMGLPKNVTIVPETLKEVGYNTYAIGKWHLGFSYKHHPMARGFDRFFGFLGGRFNYFKTTMFIRKAKDFEHVYDDYTRVDSVQYLTTDFTNRAIDYISESRKERKPFFMYLAYNTPHGPYDAPPEDFDPTVAPDRQVHVAMLKNLDDNIGRLYEHLRSLGQLRNTLIVFSNDNGGHRKGAINLPLRDFKGSWQEGGVRIPFFVHWRGHIKERQVIDDPITLMDLYPTFQAAAKVPKSKQNPKLEGKNLLPFITMEGDSKPKKKGPVHEEIILGSVRNGMVRRGDYKMIASSNVQYQLYNLKKDISERVDLKSLPEHKEMARDMFKTFRNWRLKNPPAAFPRGAPANPLSVTLTGPKGELVTGREYMMKCRAKHTNRKKEIEVQYEFFRTANTDAADFLKLKNSSIRRRYSADRKRVYVTFNAPGEWSVRANVLDGRFITWTDFKATVTAEKK